MSLPGVLSIDCGILVLVVLASQRPVPQEYVDAYHEGITLRSLDRLLSARQPKIVSQAVLVQNTPVFFPVKIGKNRQWQKRYVLSTSDHIAVVSKNVEGRGKHLKIAYEDMRLVPRSQVLEDIDEVELQLNPAVDSETPSLEDQGLAEEITGSAPSAALVSKQIDTFCLLKPTVESEEPSRDIGDVESVESPDGATLQPSEQDILRMLREEIGIGTSPEGRLQTLTSWILLRMSSRQGD